MKTDWEHTKPPTFVEVDVFVYGQVRRGAFDGLHFHFSDLGHPASNAICDPESIEAWKYVPAERDYGQFLLRRNCQLNGYPGTFRASFLDEMVSGLLGPL